MLNDLINNRFSVVIYGSESEEFSINKIGINSTALGGGAILIAVQAVEHEGQLVSGNHGYWLVPEKEVIESSDTFWRIPADSPIVKLKPEVGLASDFTDDDPTILKDYRGHLRVRNVKFEGTKICADFDVRAEVKIFGKWVKVFSTNKRYCVAIPGTCADIFDWGIVKVHACVEDKQLCLKASAAGKQFASTCIDL